jgi:hypothetical protein
MREKNRVSWGPRDLFILVFYFSLPVDETGKPK